MRTATNTLLLCPAELIFACWSNAHKDGAKVSPDAAPLPWKPQRGDHRASCDRPSPWTGLLRANRL
jgi:hypothetical protein